MSPGLIGLLCFVLMVVMILIGIPLVVSMVTGATLGLFLLGGFKMLMTQLTTGVFSLSASYTFAVIPLFMVMGQLVGATGIAEGAFSSAKKWIGGVRGGLLYTVVIANMIFGACSGMSTVGDIVFSRIALPELEKQGYNRGLSFATITASGTLSVLIPPSIPIITFCLITSVPIGGALVTGISCGIFFAVTVIIFIAVYSRIFKGVVPPRDKTKISWKERLISLRFLLPILCLFALIVGGSFLGWFPATVGGAVAVVAVLIYAVARRMPAKDIFKTIWSGLQGFANVYIIVVAGQLFGRVVALSGLAKDIGNIIADAHVAPFIIFLLVVVFYLFCGCFMDCMSIIIITVPIVFPVLQSLGYHPLVLVMLLVFSMEVAALTPPVGVAVFHVANCTGESTSFIFKHVAKFFVLDLCMILLIALIPDIALWLPKLLGYV